MGSFLRACPTRRKSRLRPQALIRAIGLTSLSTEDDSEQQKRVLASIRVCCGAGTSIVVRQRAKLDHQLQSQQATKALNEKGGKGSRCSELQPLKATWCNQRTKYVRRALCYVLGGLSRPRS